MLLRQPLLNLQKRDVGLRAHQAEQKRLVRVELGPRRLALLAGRGLARFPGPADPLDRRLDPDPEPRRRTPRRSPVRRRGQNTVPQILAVSPRHGRLPTQETIDSHVQTTDGIPLDSEIKKPALS